MNGRVSSYKAGLKKGNFIQMKGDAKMIKSNNYNKFIVVNRLRNSTRKRIRQIDQFYSDRSRILYSSSFRRLQQKAQVFSLESNASVRTRLTHSLEVSDLGRTLANNIAYRLKNAKKLRENNILSLVAIVENACLLHDIGNPPFGHFCEAAIQDWARTSIHEFTSTDLRDEIDDKTGLIKEESLLNKLINDFKEFDGNPQGFRIVTKLYTDYDKYSLNLTYSTLLCILKYPKTTGEEKGNGILKKAGFFQSEYNLVKRIYESAGLKLKQRYPFVYIMEAADDIAYCMSDIADGIEKGIITEKDFLSEFRKEWVSKFGNKKIPVRMPKEDKLRGFKQDISIPWSIKAMKEAEENFILEDDKIFEGIAESLISDKNEMGRVLETMKSVSRKILYTSFEAESIELTGYAVIIGILNKYKRVLQMKYTDFVKLIDNENIKGLDFEKRLIHFIGKRYIKAYKYELEDVDKSDEKFFVKEWWIRAHLIIDHISGMTDEYALETYQILEGIRLMR